MASADTLRRNRADKHKSRYQVNKFLKKEKAKLGFDPLVASVPRMLEETLDHLERYGLYDEGIFRVPGDALEIASLKGQYLKGTLVGDQLINQENRRS